MALEEISPSAPMEAPTAKLEIGEVENSLRVRSHRRGAPGAEMINEGWRWSWTELG
jgi:hypothetical protein